MDRVNVGCRVYVAWVNVTLQRFCRPQEEHVAAVLTSTAEARLARAMRADLLPKYRVVALTVRVVGLVRMVCETRAAMCTFPCSCRSIGMSLG